MNEESSIPSGLLSEFFADVIAKVIPGAIFLLIFFWCSLNCIWSGLNDWQSAVFFPLMLTVAWLIGTIVDIWSYWLSVKMWNFVYYKFHKKNVHKIPRTRNWYFRYLAIKIFDKKANLPFEAMAIKEKVPYKLRRLEKHMAEAAMFRNSLFVLICGTFFKHHWVYLALVVIAGFSLLIMRGNGKRLLKEYGPAKKFVRKD
jgi:hypothetical protein